MGDGRIHRRDRREGAVGNDRQRIELRLRQLAHLVVPQGVEPVVGCQAERVLAVARTDADMREVFRARAHHCNVRRVVEAPHVRQRGRCARRTAELCDHAAGDQARGGLAVRDVEAPHLATHVGGIDTVGEAVAIKVGNAHVRRERVAHRAPRRVETLRGTGRAARVPEQRAADRVDDVDRVTDRVGGQRAVVLVRLVAACDHEGQLARVLGRTGDVDVRRHRCCPGLPEARQLRAIEAEHDGRAVRVTHVERVVEVAAAAHAEVEVHLLAGIDDAVIVGDCLHAQVAVDAVLLAGRRLILVEVDLVAEELGRHERPLLDTGRDIDCM